jgi:ribosomal protein S27AE
MAHETRLTATCGNCHTTERPAWTDTFTRFIDGIKERLSTCPKCHLYTFTERA